MTLKTHHFESWFHWHIDENTSQVPCPHISSTSSRCWRARKVPLKALKTWLFFVTYWGQLNVLIYFDSTKNNLKKTQARTNMTCFWNQDLRLETLIQASWKFKVALFRSILCTLNMDVAVGIQKTIRMRSCWVGGWKGWRFAYACVALPLTSSMNLFHRHFQPFKSASCVSCGWGMLWWFTNWRDSQLLGNRSTDHGTTFFQTFGFGFFGSPPKKIDNQKYHNFQFGKRILLWRFVKLGYFCVVWFLWHVLAESRQVFVWLALQVYMQSLRNIQQQLAAFLATMPCRQILAIDEVDAFAMYMDLAKHFKCFWHETIGRTNASWTLRSSADVCWWGQIFWRGNRMQQRHHRVTHLHWKGFLIERLNWGVKKVSGKTPFFFRSPAYFCEAYQPWQNLFNYGMMLINVDEYWYLIHYLCSRASLKLGTPADSRKCQPRGLDVSTNPRYVLKNVNIFWRAGRTGLDIESHTFDTHKP